MSAQPNSNKKNAVLLIAGSDSSCGAGIAADLGVACDLEVHANIAVTAVTAQSNTQLVQIEPVNADLIYRQCQLALENFDIKVIKIAMVYNKDAIEAIANALQDYHYANDVIVDPIIASSSGKSLIKQEDFASYCQIILPLATLLTPNLTEANYLADYFSVRINNNEYSDESSNIDQRINNYRPLWHFLVDNFPNMSLYLKGGHGDIAQGDNGEKIIFDLLWLNNKEKKHSQQEAMVISGKFIADEQGNIKIMRGTGCKLATAISCYIAQGCDMEESCRLAKKYVADLISNSC